MESVLFLPVLFGFLFTLFFTPFWINGARKAGFVGRDMNKPGEKMVPEAGGVAVLLGFIFGILVYIAIKTFYFQTSENTIDIFALVSVILIISFVGFIDDLLGWKIGLNKSVRILFLIFAAIPLMVINAGDSTMIGINFGLFYPLFLIPLGIVGASATFNFLAGYNSLETTQGILILSALALTTWFTGNSWLALITLIMVSCLSAFYLFNKYPAKVFPGNVLTYTLGALIAIIAILGNIEKIAVFFFIPYILETFLKIRGKLKKESFAKVNEDRSLEIPYQKFYGLEHISIYVLKKIKKNKKVYETDVVLLINFFQILIIVLGLILFRGRIF